MINALRAEDLGNDGLPDNTLTLSSGDAFIPGLFYDASEAVFGSGGIGDIQIQNELGLQAIAFGNHEFDFGTATLAGLIDGSAPGNFDVLVGSTLQGVDFTGTDFPYLSTNLDVSTDANLDPLDVPGGAAPQANTITSSVVIEVNGENIGVVGATTPTLAIISSPGDVTIQPEDFDPTPTPRSSMPWRPRSRARWTRCSTANPDLDKVILLAHMQQLRSRSRWPSVSRMWTSSSPAVRTPGSSTRTTAPATATAIRVTTRSSSPTPAVRQRRW